MIFTPGNNPFSTRHTEARGNAVLIVDVADVGLETTRGLVVPETDGAVVGCGEDVFRVGRELDMLAEI
jgi:hypothetical protein